MPRGPAWMAMVVLPLLLFAGCGSHAGVARSPEAKPPNIVFILTDDLSWDLVNPRFTPHIVALERRRGKVCHNFLPFSLWCPPSATLFPPKDPHMAGAETTT